MPYTGNPPGRILAEQVADIARVKYNLRLVGIDGPGGTGKSTLAERLARSLKGTVVHVDDFYRPQADRASSQTTSFGAAYDLERLRSQVLEPVVAGAPVSYQRYDWATDRLADFITVETGVVIVEGVYCLSRPLMSFYDFRVVLHADRASRLERGLKRDGDAARDTWVNEWMPAEDAYFSSEVPEADSDLYLSSAAPLREAFYTMLKKPRRRHSPMMEEK